MWDDAIYVRKKMCEQLKAPGPGPQKGKGRGKRRKRVKARKESKQNSHTLFSSLLNCLNLLQYEYNHVSFMDLKKKNKAKKSPKWIPEIILTSVAL